MKYHLPKYNWARNSVIDNIAEEANAPDLTCTYNSHMEEFGAIEDGEDILMDFAYRIIQECQRAKDENMFVDLINHFGLKKL